MGAPSGPGSRASHEAAKASSPKASIPSAVPTHYCVVCAARWISWPDGNWSLASNDCGRCCDNVAMGVAPIIAIQPDGSISGEDHRRVKGAWDRARRQEAIERYRGIKCAICDAPFEQHFEDWGCPHRVMPRFKFPASAIEARRAETSGSVEDESAVGEAGTPIPDSAHAAGGDGK